MRRYLLEIPIDDHSLTEICEKVGEGSRYLQIFINVHKIVLFHKHSALRDLVCDNNCIFSIDGRWVQWFARLTGIQNILRFGGLDTCERFCEFSQEKGLRIFLLGAQEDILSKTKALLVKRYPDIRIAGTKDGFFKNEDEVIGLIRDSQAEILFLALPSPKKELLGYRAFKEIPTLKYVAGVGGAFDIFAGKIKRANVFLQRVGLEWLYRSAQEPKRLAARYLSDAINFQKIVILKLLKGEKLVSKN